MGCWGRSRLSAGCFFWPGGPVSLFSAWPDRPGQHERNCMKIQGCTVLLFVCLCCLSAYGQDRPIVIKAATILDGKGAVLRNTAIVVQGGKISKLDPNAQGAVYD